MNDATNTNMKVSLSTVTPVYAGAEYLESLVSELNDLRERWIESSAPIHLIESIFVDDGSIDNSSVVLEKLQDKFPWVTVISLSRNYGQHAATVAGICHTSSDWVVTLDEDLQHDPKFIEILIKQQTLDVTDVVYAKPKVAVHGSSWRDKSSQFVKYLMANLTSTPQIRLFNSFRLIRGSIARAAASSSSANTYFDIAISWFTKSCNSVEIELHDQRFIEENKSGYGFMKLVSHARKMIVSSEIDVASKGLVVGLGAVFLAVLIGVVSIIQKIFFPEVIETTGWASLISVVTFFSGIIIALLCIALEYTNIIVLNSLGRPTFFTIDRKQDDLLRKWCREMKSKP